VNGIINYDPSRVFGPLTTMVGMWMLTHAMSTVHVLRMLMHLSSSHVGLLRKEFQAPKFSPQSDLRCRADSRWALPQISSFFLVLVRSPPMMLCTRAPKPNYATGLMQRWVPPAVICNLTATSRLHHPARQGDVRQHLPHT